MQEVDINTLVDKYNKLNENIPNDIIIVGKIYELNIIYKYDELDLSKVECDKIYYLSQEGESIKNHILSNSLEKLYCDDNQLTSLPNLPNLLIELNCNYNEITSLPKLPNSLQKLYCSKNQLTSLPNLPNSLLELFCEYNQLSSLPDLPDSLEFLWSRNNKLRSLPLPDFTHINHELILSFSQDLPIKYIPYNTNLRLFENIDNKINIIGYPYNPITNQEELDQYMDYIKNYQLNRIKSAKK